MKYLYESGNIIPTKWDVGVGSNFYNDIDNLRRKEGERLIREIRTTISEYQNKRKNLEALSFLSIDLPDNIMVILKEELESARIKKISLQQEYSTLQQSYYEEKYL